jgi:hypothetical protein
VCVRACVRVCECVCAKLCAVIYVCAGVCTDMQPEACGVPSDVAAVKSSDRKN